MANNGLKLSFKYRHTAKLIISCGNKHMELMVTLSMSACIMWYFILLNKINVYLLVTNIKGVVKACNIS